MKISGTEVTVDLTSAVSAGEVVTVSYVRTSTAPHRLQDVACNDMADFTGQLVTNITGDTTPPTISSATVNGTALRVTFNENLDPDSTPTGSAFTVTGGRTGTGTAEISGATATVTLDSAVSPGETVTVTYTKPPSNPLRDIAENEVVTVSGQTVTNAPKDSPVIDLVRVVSWPTHDADNDGKNDTYVRDDEILVDVEFSEPVEVTGDGDVRLRLDVGADNGDRNDNRKVISLDSVRYGGRTLRFAYTVHRADTDTDGVWVQVGKLNRVVFEPKADDKVVSAITGVAANLAKSGLPTEGNPLAKVDGSRTSVAGPTPSSAAVNGEP